jgi:hypothetical protein
MARPAPGEVNKSAAIRELLEADPKTPSKEIVATLKQRGIKIHPNLVYIVKSQLKARRRWKKRQQVVENSQEMGIANPVELILEVRKLSQQAGGIKRFKQLVDALADRADESRTRHNQGVALPVSPRR